MKPEELKYPKLKSTLAPYEEKGRGESIAGRGAAAPPEHAGSPRESGAHARAEATAGAGTLAHAAS